MFKLVDHLTYNQSRGWFAGICVEIDLDKKLVPNFTLSSLGNFLILDMKDYMLCVF